MASMASMSTWGKEGGPVGSTPNAGGRGYPALDALRGLAAIIVVYYHVTGVATGFRGGIFGHGYLAVDLFFALSGFVLFHAYEERFRQGLAVGAFLWLRKIRLMSRAWKADLPKRAIVLRCELFVGFRQSENSSLLARLCFHCGAHPSESEV
jgi:uncharacterized membrane protein